VLTAIRVCWENYQEIIRKLHISLFIIYYLYIMFLNTILNNNIMFEIHEHRMFMCLQLQSFEQFRSPNLYPLQFSQLSGGVMRRQEMRNGIKMADEDTYISSALWLWYH